MKEIDKNCKVIIASGFTKNENLDGLRKLGLAGFIHKPFRDFELSKLLAEVLKGRKKVILVKRCTMPLVKVFAVKPKKY